ncbi:hypothetical protein KY290_007874 [Solanum tuberosum]|uniref:CCHC-type domain-containing protein n=1 Tax=Solanum tuberosum TaxID=4113 RepID=A0ABQ7W6W3_SOLTU|nr:hypothetical protein KY290_007874 [Solanum tuberosum]
MKGKEKMPHSSLQPLPDIDNFKIKDYSDLEDFLAKKFKGGSLQPINARDFSEGEISHKNEFSDDINKISENYARKPVQRMYYYPRPTPQDKSKDKEYTPKKKKSSKKDYEKWKKKRIEKKLRRAEEGKGDSSKRKKKYRHNYKKSDTYHKCGRFGHYAKDCRVKEKIKCLDVDDNMKDSLYKIMLNSDSGRSESEDSSIEESSTSEDLKALQQEDYITSEDECSPCQQGLQCEKDEEDDLYKIYSQFKELSLNVIDNDKVLELLQSINDPGIRAQIIDKISNNTPTKDHTPKEILTKEGSYTMAEVKNLLLERRKTISSPTTINELKDEINNLKEDIVRLKEKNVVIEVRLDAIQSLQDLGRTYTFKIFS